MEPLAAEGGEVHARVREEPAGQEDAPAGDRGGAVLGVRAAEQQLEPAGLGLDVGGEQDGVAAGGQRAREALVGGGGEAAGLAAAEQLEAELARRGGGAR